MPTSKTIYVISAEDAPKHLGYLKQILNRLKEEGRIADIKEFSSEAFNDNSLSAVSGGDMILFMLTKAIAPLKESIEATLLKLKQKQPGTKIAEILVDNLTYEMEFIAFPEDFEPIRDRADMDAVWAQIGHTLRDMFPAEKKEGTVKLPTWWSKYRLIAGAAIVVVAFFIIKGFIGGPPTPDPKKDDGASPVEESEIETTSEIKITSLLPPSPGILDVGDNVEFTFSYRADEPNGVRIFGRPMTQGNPTPHYAAHGATVSPTGEGTGKGSFTIQTPGNQVDNIRLQIWDADQKNLLSEHFVPVNYKFVAKDDGLLAAPTPTFPADQSVFNHYPRRTTLMWGPVADAASYTVETTYLQPGQNCSQNVENSTIHTTAGLTGTAYTFDFVGAQPGCWRVYAISSNGTAGKKSDWWQFTYTQ